MALDCMSGYHGNEFPDLGLPGIDRGHGAYIENGIQRLVSTGALGRMDRHVAKHFQASQSVFQLTYKRD